MKKTIIISLLGLILLNTVMGLSDPVNTSIEELRNLTRADNPLELTQEAHKLSGGKLGLFILIGLGIAALGLSTFFTRDIGKSLPITMLFITIMSALFSLFELSNETIFYGSFALLLLSVGIAFATRK